MVLLGKYIEYDIFQASGDGYRLFGRGTEGDGFAGLGNQVGKLQRI